LLLWQWVSSWAVTSSHEQKSLKLPDAAALASAAAINQTIFEMSGDQLPTCVTWANAQTFASLNDAYLTQYGINAVVPGISVDSRKLTVLVPMSANLQRLFPNIVPEVIVTENGFAEFRAFTQYCCQP
jgi:hypothetical protein